MSKAAKCERCGALYVPDENTYPTGSSDKKIMLVDKNKSRTNMFGKPDFGEADLCEKCTEAFHRFMKNE